jgi:hypothetical protein
MVSANLSQSTSPAWKILHPFNDPDCFAQKGLCEALLTASDHFPVTLDLNLPPSESSVS